MGWKDLLVIDENKKDNKEQTETPKQNAVKFPSTDTTTPTTQSSGPTGLFSGFGFGSDKTTQKETASVPNEYIEKALEIYSQGFNSLNQNGYDFFEFYQSVMQVGPDNPQIYPMAFAMGSAMEKTISKDKLAQQADYYINEINKVYNDYVNKGNAKKQELETQKNNENHILVSELELMRQQMEALGTQIQDRKSKLNAIGSKYEPQIAEVDSKLAANNIAKSQIVDSIEKVKNGIVKHLK